MRFVFTILTALSLSIPVFAQQATRRVSRAPNQSTAMGSPPRQEVLFGAAGSGKLVSEKSGGVNRTVIEAHGSYLRGLGGPMQIGGEFGIFSSSGGKSQSYIEAVAVGAYNFGHRLSDSMYAKGGVGLLGVLSDTGDYKSEVGFFVGGGKRFPLWAGVAYNPELRLYKKGKMDPSIEIWLINISVIW
ncbi:MAG: hypothetical protein KF802_06950 [Bdellovibrionaceae bacterium]|nr:hypothetical protein [Pseudobdellovibrionaceae bacterium]MBX3034356.1 hypothetical protein [Pseudobdellovibrionaceae bacterium]